MTWTPSGELTAGSDDPLSGPDISKKWNFENNVVQILQVGT